MTTSRSGGDGTPSPHQLILPIGLADLLDNASLETSEGSESDFSSEESSSNSSHGSERPVRGDEAELAAKYELLKEVIDIQASTPRGAGCALQLAKGVGKALAILGGPGWLRVAQYACCRILDTGSAALLTLDPAARGQWTAPVWGFRQELEALIDQFEITPAGEVDEYGVRARTPEAEELEAQLGNTFAWLVKVGVLDQNELDAAMRPNVKPTQGGAEPVEQAEASPEPSADPLAEGITALFALFHDAIRTAEIGPDELMALSTALAGFDMGHLQRELASGGHRDVALRLQNFQRSVSDAVYALGTGDHALVAGLCADLDAARRRLTADLTTIATRR